MKNEIMKIVQHHMVWSIYSQNMEIYRKQDAKLQLFSCCLSILHTETITLRAIVFALLLPHFPNIIGFLAIHEPLKV